MEWIWNANFKGTSIFAPFSPFFYYYRWDCVLVTFLEFAKSNLFSLLRMPMLMGRDKANFSFVFLVWKNFNPVLIKLLLLQNLRECIILLPLLLTHSLYRSPSCWSTCLKRPIKCSSSRKGPLFWTFLTQWQIGIFQGGSAIFHSQNRTVSSCIAGSYARKHVILKEWSVRFSPLKFCLSSSDSNVLTKPSALHPSSPSVLDSVTYPLKALFTVTNLSITAPTAATRLKN